MRRKPLFGRHETNIVGRKLQGLAVVTNHRRALQKIVRAQAVGEAGRPAGGQDVRRTGHIITDGDRRIVTQKDRARILNFRQNFFRAGR